MGHNNKGFGVLEIVLVVAAIAVVGFVGWKAYVAFSNNKKADTSQSQQATTEQAPAVTDNASLDKSAATLDAIDVGGTESTQFKSQANF